MKQLSVCLASKTREHQPVPLSPAHQLVPVATSLSPCPLATELPGWSPLTRTPGCKELEQVMIPQRVKHQLEHVKPIESK